MIKICGRFSASDSFLTGQDIGPILRLNPLRGGVDNHTFLNGNLRLSWALRELKIASESYLTLPTTIYKKASPYFKYKKF